MGAISPLSKVTKTLNRILRGNADASIRFGDMRALLHHYGFEERIRGDHHIFTRNDVAEIINLQPRGSKAKPYQVKQVRGLLTSAGIIGVSESDEPSTGEDSTGGEDLTQTEENDVG